MIALSLVVGACGDNDALTPLPDSSELGPPVLVLNPEYEYMLLETVGLGRYADGFASFDSRDTRETIKWLATHGADRNDSVLQELRFTSERNEVLVVTTSERCPDDEVTLSVWPQFVDRVTEEPSGCSSKKTMAEIYVLPRAMLTEVGLMQFTRAEPIRVLSTGQELAASEELPRPDTSIMPLEFATDVSVNGIAFSEQDAEKLFGPMGIGEELRYLDLETHFVVAASTDHCYPEDGWLEVSSDQFTYATWQMPDCAEAVDVSAIFVVPHDHPNWKGDASTELSVDVRDEY